MTSITRWLDGQPPSVEETILNLHQALLHYVQLLKDLRDDEINEGRAEDAKRWTQEIEKAEAFVRDLDHWGLCPDLHGLIKGTRA